MSDEGDSWDDCAAERFCDDPCCGLCRLDGNTCARFVTEPLSPAYLAEFGAHLKAVNGIEYFRSLCDLLAISRRITGRAVVDLDGDRGIRMLVLLAKGQRQRPNIQVYLAARVRRRLARNTLRLFAQLLAGKAPASGSSHNPDRHLSS